MGKNICEFLKNYEDFTYSDRATIEEIREAEKQLNLKFADEYVECLLNYGLVSIEDIELTGITDFKALSVVHETITEKEFEGHLLIRDDMYLVHSLDYDDVLAWQDRSGAVYMSVPFREPIKVSDSLAEYVEKSLNDELMDDFTDEEIAKLEEEDIISVINKLDDVYALSPVSNAEIQAAENALGLKFAKDYRSYVYCASAICGGGIELTGITEFDRLNVVPITERERKRNPLIKDNMYVVEVVGIDGIVILQDEVGTIYAAQPNVAPQKLFNSLIEYIKNVGRFCQNENARDEFVYKWRDEFGQNLVKRMENGLMALTNDDKIVYLHHKLLETGRHYKLLPLIEFYEEEYYDPITTKDLFDGVKYMDNDYIIECVKQKQLYWNLRSNEY